MDTVDTTGGAESSATQTGPEDTGSESNAQQTEAAQPYIPFAAGREKFTINGQEEEWDWDTTKRYAQIGKAGYSNLETAAKMRKEAERVQSSAKQVYSQLLEYAKRDPEGLIKVLNPAYGNSRQQAQPEQGGFDEYGEATQTRHDPRDLKIAGLEERLQKWEAEREAQLDQAERKAMENEFSQVQEKFSRFKHPAANAYLRDQYRKAIVNGLDLSVEDVAQMVEEKLSKFDAQGTQAKVQRYEKNRERSPVSGVSAGIGKKGEMTLEDVKRLAGRMT